MVPDPENNPADVAGRGARAGKEKNGNREKIGDDSCDDVLAAEGWLVNDDRRLLPDDDDDEALFPFPLARILTVLIVFWLPSFCGFVPLPLRIA